MNKIKKYAMRFALCLFCVFIIVLLPVILPVVGISYLIKKGK